MTNAEGRGVAYHNALSDINVSSSMSLFAESACKESSSLESKEMRSVGLSCTTEERCWGGVRARWASSLSSSTYIHRGSHDHITHAGLGGWDRGEGLGVGQEVTLICCR